MHPLSGADLGTLWSVLTRSGGVASGKLMKTAGIVGAAVGRWPFSTAEYYALSGSLPDLTDMPPPIFIVGHWRSGTTHLYNIMSKDAFGFVPPVATGLPWDLMGLARALGPLLDKALPESRFIDNIPVTPDAPQEDEIALANMTPLSFYHAIYFPERFTDYLTEGLFFDNCSADDITAWRERFEHFMRKLYVHQDRKRLLIKNPVYTARVSLLHEIMPQARFIHIHRNPYDVFVSMRNFYKKLLKEFALQDYAHVDIDQAILDTYARMMRILDEDLAALPRHLYTELSYDHLDDEPLTAVEQIYRDLDIEGFETIRPTFSAYLDSVKTYKKNRFSYGDAEAALVEGHWGEFVNRWSYRRPAPQEPA